MLTRSLRPLSLGIVLALLAACATPVASPPSSPSGGGASKAASSTAPSLAKLPLYFVANYGQTDPHVSFYLPGKDNTVYFSPDGLTFAFTSARSPTAPGPV